MNDVVSKVKNLVANHSLLVLFKLLGLFNVMQMGLVSLDSTYLVS